jgi:hypothetical protein
MNFMFVRKRILVSVFKRIDYDLTHGVQGQEVVAFLAKVRNDRYFWDLRSNQGFYERLGGLGSHFKKTNSKSIPSV